MKEIKDYERAKLELVYFSSNDVISTSTPPATGDGGPLGSSGEPDNWDTNGWT